jgi:CheY-like chemotaxis protein
MRFAYAANCGRGQTIIRIREINLTLFRGWEPEINEKTGRAAQKTGPGGVWLLACFALEPTSVWIWIQTSWRALKFLCMSTALEMAAAATANTSKPKILLADDDPGIRQILVRLLSEENYLVLTAANGVEALTVTGTAKIDLALLDLNMPVKGGWETFEQLSARNPLLPVILITARPNQFFPALAAGVGALLEKPLDFAKLFQTIHDLLAEPDEVRLARSAGRSAAFSYVPSNSAEAERKEP